MRENVFECILLRQTLDPISHTVGNAVCILAYHFPEISPALVTRIANIFNRFFWLFSFFCNHLEWSHISSMSVADTSYIEIPISMAEFH